MHCSKDVGGGVGLVSALRLGHWWVCKIGLCAAAGTSVVVGLILHKIGGGGAFQYFHMGY